MPKNHKTVKDHSLCFCFCGQSLFFRAFPVSRLQSRAWSFACLAPFARRTKKIVNKIGTARQIFGTVPRLPVPRLPPGGSLGTPKIMSTGATLHLGPIRLHLENWNCVPLNRQHGAKNLACRAGFFSACKWGCGLRREGLFTTYMGKPVDPRFKFRPGNRVYHLYESVPFTGKRPRTA